MAGDNNIKGIIVMVLSMAAFALADMLVKLAGASLSPPQILTFLMGGSLVLFTLIAKMQGEQLLKTNIFSPILLLRYAAEIIGMTGMVLALTYVPLSTVGAITQAAPILVAVGAALLLGETVSWRRWTSIAVGFAGVLLIIRPGASGFEATVLWAVLAMVALAIRDLTTRLIPASIGSASLASYTMFVAVPFAASWTLLNGDPLLPEKVDWLVVLPMILLGSLGYILLIISLRMALVSVVTPFRYTRIVFLILLGVIVFGERPDALTLFGATLVIVSGVYIILREHRVKRS